MTKQFDKNKSIMASTQNSHFIDKNTAAIPFIEFWTFVSESMGNARLRINTEADSINEFIDSSGDPKEYLISLIQSSYKRSQCYHLRAPICVNSVLDILGETAYELQSKQQDDLYDIEFLEEIAFYISERYAHRIMTCETDDPKVTTANIYRLAKHKIRIENAKT